MRIGLITAVYRPLVNGVTQMVALYRKYMEKAGHQVTVFTLGNPPEDDPDPATFWSPGLPLGNSGYYLAPRYLSDAQALIRELDILHCHHPVMALEFASRYGNSPIVFTNHSRYDLYLQSYAGIPESVAEQVLHFFWGRMLDTADTVISPAESNRQILLRYGVNKPIRVIPNGIEIERFSRPEQVLTKSDLGLPDHITLCVYCGRLAKEKNVRFLLQEFNQAAQEDDNLHLMLIGSGPEEGHLVNFAQELGFGQRVHFIGEINNRELPPFLKAADIFVTASITEVLPLSVIEAMATGLPVVAISSPGIDDLVEDEVTGLIATDRPTDLPRKLSTLARSAELRKSMGMAGLVASKRYDIQRTVSQTLDLYQEVLQGKANMSSVAKGEKQREGM